MPSLESTRSSSFAADVLKLVTGTTVAQVIAALASPLLTRLYGPEAFGLLALFTSITSIIGVVACMPLANSRSCSRRPMERPQPCWV